MTKIEDAFAALCATHNLTHLDVGFSPDTRWVSYAHWAGRGCAQAFGDTADEAIANAITESHAKRAMPPVEVPALTLEVAA